MCFPYILLSVPLFVISGDGIDGLSSIVDMSNFSRIFACENGVWYGVNCCAIGRDRRCQCSLFGAGANTQQARLCRCQRVSPFDEDDGGAYDSILERH